MSRQQYCKKVLDLIYFIWQKPDGNRRKTSSYNPPMQSQPGTNYVSTNDEYLCELNDKSA